MEAHRRAGERAQSPFLWALADDVESEAGQVRRLDREVDPLVALEPRDDQEAAASLVGRLEGGGVDRRMDDARAAAVEAARSGAR